MAFVIFYFFLKFVRTKNIGKLYLHVFLFLSALEQMES